MFYILSPSQIFWCRLPAPSDLCVDGAASSTPKRRASSPLTTSSSTDDGEDHKPIIKQERIDTTTSSPEEHSHKKSRTEVADAESNTTHSGKCWFFYKRLFLIS